MSRRAAGVLRASIAGALLLWLVAPAAAEDEQVQVLMRELQALKNRVEQLERELAQVREPPPAGAQRVAGPDEPVRQEGAEEYAEQAPPEAAQPPTHWDLVPGIEEYVREMAAEVHAERLAVEKDDAVTISGALWLNYALRDFDHSQRDRGGDFGFDLFRLSVDASLDDFQFSGQYRWYSFMDVIHHGWVGYRFSDSLYARLGINQVPFGIQPYASHSYWFGAPYYVGLEDDYDAGIKLIYDEGPWNLQGAFYKNAEYGNSARLNRYSYDLVRTGAQQNEEINQLNARAAYTFDYQNDYGGTEVGLSGQWGQLRNQTTGDTDGHHWALGAHMNGFYGPWNLQLEALRYEIDPANPAGVSDRFVTMGAFGAAEQVASQATVLVGNVARDFGVRWGPITKLTCYNDHSIILKDENTFDDSQLNVLGCSVTAGPTFTYVDLISGKNMTFLNDPGTGLGPGAADDWETRFNVNFEYYF